ncbi:PepSY domain-containing protein [Streptomyces aureocirculatus]|uniref:PepSY domain-containing protein n=1 Tax=Streptomyces aureocirculatus TaxID=67275 RepID=UPI0004C5D0B7|nr:PepSY domain-containing protein [Streptomyces aureocirculatus]
MAPRGAGLVCAAAVAAALLTGCGNDDGDDGAKTGAAGTSKAPTSAPTTASGATLTEDQAERKELVPKAKVGYDKALDAAVAAVDKSKPVSVELKGTPDKPVWETEVATADGAAHTVDVDAVTGKADKARAKSDEDADDKRELADRLGKAKVSAQQAAQTATDKTKGTVTSVELEDSDKAGTLVWSVDVVTTKDWNKTTYDIDAVSRKIVREHVDRD